MSDKSFVLSLQISLHTINLFNTGFAQFTTGFFLSMIHVNDLITPVLIQASGKAHSLQWQPWNQAPYTRAVPHTPAAEGGVHTTSASPAEGECGEITAQVNHFLLLLKCFTVDSSNLSGNQLK